MLVLWPDESPPETEELGELVGGEIVRVEVLPPDDARDTSSVAGPQEVADLEVRLTSGPDTGETVVLEQMVLDGYPPMSPGDRVHLDQVEGVDGSTTYFLTDFERTPALLLLLTVFVLAVLVIGRWHGLRSLFGLAASLLIVVWFVLPAILDGRQPPVVALVGAVAIMVLTLYLVHGINEMTTAAIVGTSGALLLTVGLGLFFISRGRITGFASEDALFASFAVQGLDLQGLVLAGLIIASLGVLDDVSVSQASTVFALHDTDRTLGWSSLFRRAMSVGRDHIASVVNTLFLAYAGASLAVLVLFSTSGVATGELLNSEVVAVEIVKIVVGSLGLIAAVPLTTALAAAVAVDATGTRRPVGSHHHGHVDVGENAGAESPGQGEPVLDPDRLDMARFRRELDEQADRGGDGRSAG